MEKKPKILLAGAIICLVFGLLIALGWVNIPNAPGLHVVLPLSVILFGMFLITRCFEKESKVAVDDQQRALSKAGMHVPRDETPAKQGAVMAQ